MFPAVRRRGKASVGALAAVEHLEFRAAGAAGLRGAAEDGLHAAGGGGAAGGWHQFPGGGWRMDADGGARATNSQGQLGGC